MEQKSYKQLEEYNLQKSILNERLEKYGLNSLLNEEVTSILTTIPTSKLKKYLDSYGLVEAIKYLDDFQITAPQRRKLELLYEFARRVSIAPYREKISLDNSSRTGEYFIKELKFLGTESFLLAILDTQNRVVSCDVVSSGTINETAIYPREIVKLCLLRNASSVILAHNHPGGGLNPSSADLETTRKIAAALIMVNIKVIDHIIVSEDRYISFAEKGLL